MKVAMKYCAHFTFTTTTGLSTDRIFRLNSIRDPDVTGAGHNPLGYDQWALMYEKYRVDACTVIVRLASTSTGGYFSLVGNHSSSSITDPTNASESPNSITRVHSVNTNTTIAKKFDLPALAGVTRTQYQSDDVFEATFGNDPASQLMVHLVFASSDITTVGVINFQVELIYYTTCFQGLQLAQS